MPLKDYFSLRVTDPSECEEGMYATKDIGRHKGLLMYRCVLKKDADKIKGGRPTRSEWKKYGVVQRYIISIDNVGPCEIGDGLKTLCAKNSRGKKEINSLLSCKRKDLKNMACKEIVKKTGGEWYEYRLVDTNPVVNLHSGI